MNNECQRSGQTEAPTLASIVEAKIKTLLGLNVTVMGVNISELLATQRSKIAVLQQESAKKDAEYEALRSKIVALQQESAKKDAEYEALRLAYKQLWNESPKQHPAEEPAAEEEQESEVNVEIKVTGNGPIPPELAAMLNDLTSMLQSVAHKK